ncbi:DNA-binding ATP-dependent protease La [Desulfamplus magnetovallimortis]|uniref:Lon protease n=1 Tax=Desulfamplus magnetovallimortis TaxID=1246637 RepID=A0A1W1HKB0_9BACT|nr:endopeptidase La [Desulfamplus magnetovallimortis]SLM32957.1 DNA-binding ATP-dependent protease La [Desulfamplus magnetovallimortis]
MAETDMDDLIEIIENEGNIDDIPMSIPMMPVRDVVVFIDMLLPLFVGREKSIKAIEESAKSHRYIFLSVQKDSDLENPGPDDVFLVGTVARVQKMLKLPDGRIKALVQGIAKGKIEKFERKRSWFKVKFDILTEEEIDSKPIEIEALMRNVRESSEKILALRGELSGDVGAILEQITSPGKLADLVASNLRLKVDEAQDVLETFDQKKRLEKVNDFLNRELELSTVQAKIQTHVKDEISKTQRDYFLREQVKAIHRELGDGDDKLAEIENYNEKIKKAKMPPECEKEALIQLKRLDQMHSDSSEAAIIRTYIDAILELPWSKSTKDFLDIKKAAEVLDQNHYGLEKVKDRILEYLSVRKLNPAIKGQILCFSGPPGVGKTSLGKAIARAMKRKFVRVSLGGIRDEAEIRGHRRTYIGAMPGRILQGLKQCGSNNPVFMLDEIDKLGNDFRGDPSSALLEALDSEQNSEFSDHYLNMPFDLSQVLFVLTANMTDTIPSALLDRMEIIRIPGYTHEEKEAIARKYLLPRQIKENGLVRRSIHISDNALDTIISEYTLEAGLRELERKIGTVLRKIARQIAEGKKGKFSVTRQKLIKFLGPPIYLPELDQEESQAGLVTGLAWTEVGGEPLYIEVSLCHGKGELSVTGQIGDVMQESARAAFSYTKANMDRFNIDRDDFENKDIHIHVPAGAIPKDGPSAGIAMATALISAFTGRVVNNNVAMTGEISLRGRVLPIGGLKEKALGALRAGIKTVVIPEKNRKDLYEIPQSVKNNIEFICVQELDQVLDIAFVKQDDEPERDQGDGVASEISEDGDSETGCPDDTDNGIASDNEVHCDDDIGRKNDNDVVAGEKEL